MSSRYDEDIYENPFYQNLEKLSPSLYEQATTKRWIICVPRFSCASKVTVTKEDFEDHVLIADESSEEKYHTVSKHVVIIKQGVITLEHGFPKPKKVSILFEETCYNNNDESYRVLCVSEFFNRESSEEITGLEEESYKQPASYDECLNLLWGDNPNHNKTRDQLDKILARFSSMYEQFEGESLMSLVDVVSEQMTEAMQIVLKDPTVRRSVKHSGAYMNNLKIAMEVYMMHKVHKPLFATITALVKSQDAEINKMTRNLTEIRLHHLGIGKDFDQNLPLAKKELAMLNNFSTPLRRLNQMKRVVTALTRTTQKSSDVSTDSMMTTDDFLPLLIYLILKSQIPNWTANLVYMRHFHKAKVPEDGEYSFYLATTEAALDYIRSGNLKAEKSPGQKIQSPRPADMENKGKTGLNRQSSGGSSTTREKFFQYVQFGDEAAVCLMLKKKPSSSNDELLSQLCHPLCSCDKCSKLIAKSKHNSSVISPFSRDDMGRTALHVASLFGRASLIDILIKYGCLVDATDFLNCTPLHLACQSGHQNVILLLVHFGADISSWDNEGNTPLHMCTANGHEDCVKAILFLDILKNRLNVNAKNDMGDTPLHLAAKWGYEGIVRFLLDTEADPRIRNRKKQTALNLAQNKVIKQQLQQVFDDPPPIISRRKQEVPNTLPYFPPPVQPLTKAESDGFDVIDVQPAKKAISMKDNPEIMSPKTPEVASLDQADVRKRELLFKAIASGDVPLVKFHLSWTDDSPEDDDLGDLSPPVGSLCHPLCQCSKCQPIQKLPSSGGLNVNSVNKKGFSPLHISVIENQVELCRLFLKKGAKVNVETHKRITPLHLACFHANLTIVQELVNHGANINIQDMYGEIPLHLACAKQSLGIARILIQGNSHLDQTNIDGNTPLHHAAALNNLEMVQLLLEAGANPNLQNQKQHTPLSLSKEEKVQRCLLDKMALQKPSTHRSISTGGIPTPPPDPGGQRPRESPRKPTLKEMFSSLEEDNLKTLEILRTGIHSFDKQRSLKRSKTFDRSGADISWLKHSLSIQHFDSRTLRHVDLIDKADPLYIYSLSYQDHTQSSIDIEESKIKNSEIVLKGNNSGSFDQSEGDNSTLAVQAGSDPNTRDHSTSGVNCDSTTEICEPTCPNHTAADSCNRENVVVVERSDADKGDNCGSEDILKGGNCRSTVEPELDNAI